MADPAVSNRVLVAPAVADGLRGMSGIRRVRLASEFARIAARPEGPRLRVVWNDWDVAACEVRAGEGIVLAYALLRTGEALRCLCGPSGQSWV